MKLSEQIKQCLEERKCTNCDCYDAETVLTCKKLMQKSYERIKKYEEMFPCKVGDIIYRIFYPSSMLAFIIVKIEIYKEEIIIIDDSDNKYHVKDFGKKIFLSKSDAEAALHKMNETEKKGNV